jgi:hypothetical protein
MKDLLMLLLQIIGVACLLGFVFWIFNKFLGFSMGFKGNTVPTEWEAGIAFFVVAALCFGIVYMFGRKPKTEA